MNGVSKYVAKKFSVFAGGLGVLFQIFVKIMTISLKEL